MHEPLKPIPRELQDSLEEHDLVGGEPIADIDGELSATPPVLAASLAQFLAPPADLDTRTSHNVRGEIHASSELSILTDLLFVGWRTLVCLVSGTERKGGGDAG